ncbi:MAG: DUF1385 domain-containing protein [Desulfovibrionaceae bacterium]|nr:DUF1385 domain-containing protein [Desulfovibrionaceae bacterium]
MEGVMMRNGDVYGLAVRRSDNSIQACLRPWVSVLNYAPLRVPFLRGFPILLETLYNGIGALNKSALLIEDASATPLSKWQLILSLIIAIVLAIGLFVLGPHFLALFLFWQEVSGNVEGLSFHFWDGFFKVLIFLGYLWLIARLPEIRAVLAYHGAEHKTIHAFERASLVTAETAQQMSRLHPRCGTTFLLFVIILSIILHALLVPLFLQILVPSTELAKHLWTLGLKIMLIVPISAVAYELIKLAARVPKGFKANLLQAPGLFLQKLTTLEPNLAQLEVAIVALYTALDADDRQDVKPVPFGQVKGDESPRTPCLPNSKV